MQQPAQPQQVQKAMRAAGILLIIGGVFNLATSVFFLVRAGGFAPFSGATPTVWFVLLGPLVGGVLQVFTGLLGAAFGGQKQKALLCICFGVATLLFLLAVNITTMSLNGQNPLLALAGVMMPGLYLLCAFQMRKLP